ncbi:MAG TPA: Do family serine endopeptidase [Acidobacteriota bacterium]
MKSQRFVLGGLLLVAILGIVLMVFDGFTETIKSQQKSNDIGAIQSTSTNTAERFSPSDFKGEPLTVDVFQRIAERMKPTVVNVYTTQIMTERNPFLEDPFFRRFFGDNPEEQFRQNALGSGFIIDSNGFILTNNHVVENAEEIRVSLRAEQLGQGDYKAKIVGRDPKTDLALIQIDTDKQLLAAPLGDSEKLAVGQWVIAIGNPFNLGRTVTVGVVSATGRALGGPYDEFIQTDASINPGNSGGPLLNLRGEVIGINTAIASRSGQSAGIGFAVPINVAKEIVPQLRSNGKVTRGELGVTIQSLLSQTMQKQFGVDHGALVSGVREGSPAEKAGIKTGNVIVEYNGTRLDSSADLPRLVASTKPGTQANLKIVRDGKEKTITTEVGRLEDTEVASSSGVTPGSIDLGINVMELDADTARRLNLEISEGVVITDVNINSPADDAGLVRKDVILEINRGKIKSIEDYNRMVSGTQRGGSLLFLINRRGATFFVTVDVPERK